MYKKEAERKITVKENMFNEKGTIIFKEIASNEEMFDKTSMYAELTIKENCGIGYHKHTNEEEVILVIAGKATCNNDGKEFVANKGDVIICEDGHEHSIVNKEKEELKLVAIKIKK